MTSVQIGLTDRDKLKQENGLVSDQANKSILSTDTSRGKIVLLDGIRAVACISVLFYHVNFNLRVANVWHPIHGLKTLLAAFLDFGDSGVMLFFLLSGFLLFLPYARWLLFDGSRPSLRRFYLRRIFRIIPGYFFALFFLVLFFHSELFHPDHRQDLWLFLTFRMDFVHSQLVNGPFWTLAVEFQFYLLLPLIAGLFSLFVRRGTLRSRVLKLTLCLLVMLAWGLVTRYWGMYIADTSRLDSLIPHIVSVKLKPYLYGDTGKFFEVFAVGMLLCMLYVYTQNAANGEMWSTRIRRLSPVLFFAGLALLTFLSLWHVFHLGLNVYTKTNVDQLFTFLNPYIPQLINYWVQWEALGYAICYGLCMLALLYGLPRLRSVLETRFFSWVGSISFSLYMWHLPCIWLFMWIVLPRLLAQGWNRAIIYAAFWCWVAIVIVPISMTLYRWIELPGIRLGEILLQKVSGKTQKSVPSM